MRDGLAFDPPLLGHQRPLLDLPAAQHGEFRGLADARRAGAWPLPVRRSYMGSGPENILGGPL